MGYDACEDTAFSEFHCYFGESEHAQPFDVHDSLHRARESCLFHAKDRGWSLSRYRIIEKRLDGACVSHAAS